MKKCRLCGRVIYKGGICSECRGKIGSFAKKTILGVGAAAGAVAAGIFVKKNGTEGIEKKAKDIEEKIKSIPVAEGKEKLVKMGSKVLEEGRETVNLAESIIEEHTMGVRELVEKGIDAAEYRLKGLPAAYAREEHPITRRKFGEIVDGIRKSIRRDSDDGIVTVSEEEWNRMMEEDK